MGRLLGDAVRSELLRGAEALVCLVAGQEPVGRSPVAVQSLHLAIWGERSPVTATGGIRPLVPLEPEPLKLLDDVRLEPDRAASHVSVLEPEDERATVPARMSTSSRAPNRSIP